MRLCKHGFFQIVLGLRTKLWARSKKNAIIKIWINYIINRLYWVVTMGLADGDLVVSMWMSRVNHVCNKHADHEGPYKECIHGPHYDREWTRQSKS